MAGVPLLLAFSMMTLGTEDVYMVAEVDTEDPREHERLADLIRQHVTKNSAVALRHVRLSVPDGF